MDIIAKSLSYRLRALFSNLRRTFHRRFHKWWNNGHSISSTLQKVNASAKGFFAERKMNVVSAAILTINQNSRSNWPESWRLLLWAKAQCFGHNDLHDYCKRYHAQHFDCNVLSSIRDSPVRFQQFHSISVLYTLIWNFKRGAIGTILVYPGKLFRHNNLHQLYKPLLCIVFFRQHSAMRYPWVGPKPDWLRSLSSSQKTTGENICVQSLTLD